MPVPGRSYSKRGGARGRGRRSHGHGGPRLPSVLLAEVDPQFGNSRRHRRQPTRNDQREAARRGRGTTHQVGRGSRREEEEEESAPSDTEAVGVGDDLKATSKNPVKSAPSARSLGKRPATDDDIAQAKKKKRFPELTLSKGTIGNAEDEEIEWLEYMLRKDKRKGAGEAELDDDGLDELLDFADLIGPGGNGLPRGIRGGSEDGYNEVDDDDDGLGVQSSLGCGETEEEFGEFDEEQDLVAGLKDTGDELGSQTYRSHTPPSLPDEVPMGGSTSPPPSKTSLVPLSQSDASSRYIPPHLRAVQLEEKARGDKQKAEERLKLERKSQGLLNKLSEANIESILAEMEALYRDHSRNEVTTTLTNLIIQMISNRSNLLDSFVILYATLVGALHRVVGMEFGAHFVHSLVMQYHQLSASSETNPRNSLAATIYQTPDASKESLNLLVLIAELYNAQVISARLIYDLIRGFVDSGSEIGEAIGEREVEGLLKIIRCSGPQLRSDDPTSLKDIVTLVQDRAKGKERTMTTRTRFMVETLSNLKSGKIKGANGVEAGAEAATRMKKFLGGLGRKRRLLAYEPLRVSLADMLAADSTGKWWLVGAGWSGNPLLEREETLAAQPKKKIKTVRGDEEVLFELARKQGMNTDVRRGVFVVLMTSEDYAHACERLTLLRLTDVQQREFSRVALHCCGLERVYNPYYTLILTHLCAGSYDHRFTLQYALWDFLRELDNEDPDIEAKSRRRRSSNVAKAFAYIIARGGMDLTVFKAVDFISLPGPTIVFLMTFLTALFIATQTTSPLFALPKSYKRSSFNAEPIEELFDKTLSNIDLAQGWLWVIEREMGKKGQHVLEELGSLEGEVVKRGLEIATRIVSRATYH